MLSLSTHKNIKLLKQLESGFKRTINWNKYQPKITNQAENKYLEFLIDSSFQGVNRLFVLSFEYKDLQKDYKHCRKNDYNIMIDGLINFFFLSNSKKWFKNIW